MKGMEPGGGRYSEGEGKMAERLAHLLVPLLALDPPPPPR